jgi:UPF0271 protein
MKINCDIGERGADHPVDRELMRHIQIANIACGGHAGDEESIAVFRALAEEHGVEISAHLSYPDRENFGRQSLNISAEALCQSLDEQLAKMDGVFSVKFHGALYNDSVRDPAQAETLANWLVRNEIKSLITPADSEMARSAERAGIQIIAEAFADRRYVQAENGQLQLLSRAHPEAVYETLDEALAQSQLLSERQVITHEGQSVPIQADTLCVHSDSAISLPLIHALKKQEPPFKFIHSGLSFLVTSPAFGKQAHGVTPGGPQDRFAFETGHALLQTEGKKRALEFIIPPVLKITRSARFMLTGARFENRRILRGNQTIPIAHATVFRAEPGDEIRFGQNGCGLRGYLSWNKVDGPIGQTRPPLTDLVTWREPHGLIRLIKGPELERLIQPERLISNPWKIGNKSGAMGIQLETPGLPLETEPFNMISAPVTDGTVQLTPNGPIVLMRHRQTIGGYPRIANVIEVDLDRLAQFRPGEVIRFTWTDIKTARNLLAQRQAVLRKK